MLYSLLIAQIENPITEPWQRSQLYNFTALCFLCEAMWRDISSWIIRRGCLLISTQISPLYPRKVLQCSVKFAFFFHWCDKQDWATVWYVLGSSPGTDSEQIVRSLVEEVGSAAGVGPFCSWSRRAQWWDVYVWYWETQIHFIWLDTNKSWAGGLVSSIIVISIAVATWTIISQSDWIHPD